MSRHQLNLSTTLAASPSATRAHPIRISACKNAFAYGSGNCVIVRDISDPSKVLVSWKHTSPVTAVRLSPSGARVASGDRDGNIILWANRPEMNEIYSGKQLGGAVFDIAWSDDEERLVIVGEGKTSFAAVITSSGNTIGTINGHSQNILSADFRRARPYRIATGSADSQVGFYEGPPFKFVSNTAGHKNAVTCVRYSPDLSVIASVSGSADIMLQDGKTGEKLRTVPSGHTGTIYSLDWTVDGKAVITASADKSVRVTNIDDGSNISAVSFGTTVNQMQQGVVCAGTTALAVSFGGALSHVDYAQGTITQTWLGHRARVLLLHNDAASDALVSVAVDGSVLVWKNGGEAGSARAISVPGDSITAACVGSDGSKIYAVVGTKLVSFSAKDSEVTEVSSEANNATGVASLGNGLVALMHRGSVVLVDASTGDIAKEEKLPPKYDASSIAAHGDMFAVGGDKAVMVFQAGSGGASVSLTHTFAGHHAGVVSAVAFSKDGQSIASGDAMRNIFVWKTATGDIVYDELIFHSLRVSALEFNAAGDQLISGSVDASIILWNLQAKTRKTEDSAHRGGVSAVAFTNSGEIVSVGGDFCIRKWKQN